MKRTAIFVVLAFGAGIAVGVSVLTVSAAQPPIRAVKLTQLLKTDLSGCEGKEVTVSIIEAGAGTSPRHYHPGDSFTYVLEGSQLRETDEGQAQFGAGAVIHDRPAQIHRTETAAPVKLLVVRVLEKGKPENIIVK